MRIPYTVAKQISTKVNHDWGENVSTPEEVQRVAHGLPLPAGKAHVESRIMQELEEHGHGG